MPKDRNPRSEIRAEDLPGRGEYGEAYEAPYDEEYRGYGSGYGSTLRSRGSYFAGQLRSGLNPRDEFEWGEGYVGGRGYGGTNYDLRHGYRTGSLLRAASEPAQAYRQGQGPYAGETGSPRVRRGYEAGSDASYPTGYRLEAEASTIYGPARYGYGPYFERLRRRRRSDDEIREDVEEALFYDTWVDADRIQVAVEDGVVTLTGTLPSYDEVRYATDDAWDVDGVRGVRTQLTVGEEAPARQPAAGRAQRRQPSQSSAAEATPRARKTAGRANAGSTRAADAGKKAASPGRGRAGRTAGKAKAVAATTVNAGAQGAAVG